VRYRQGLWRRWLIQRIHSAWVGTVLVLCVTSVVQWSELLSFITCRNCGRCAEDWLTDWLNNCMVLSSSWEANSYSSCQEIARVLWNPTVHYRVHKSPPLVPVLKQMYPVRRFYVPKIHSNIILPSTRRSWQWSLPFRFIGQNFVCTSHLPHACWSMRKQLKNNAINCQFVLCGNYWNSRNLMFTSFRHNRWSQQNVAETFVKSTSYCG
jgi:hypothetical protein